MNSVLLDQSGLSETSRLLAAKIAALFRLEQVSLFASPSVAIAHLLQNLGIVAGDAVMLSPLAPLYWFDAFLASGVVPIWIDVGSKSPVIDPSLVAAEGTPSVKAIVVDTCLGYHPNYAVLNGLNMIKIHDLSQGFGGQVGEESLGRWGDVVFAHFGDEGLLAAVGGCALGRRRGHSSPDRNWLVRPWESLSHVAASLLDSQWSEVNELSEGKRSSFASLFQRLSRDFMQPSQDGPSVPVCPVFPVMVDTGAKDVLAYSRKNAVEADWAFREHSVSIPTSALDQCPNARYFVQHTLAFPLYSRFSAKELEAVGKVLASLP